jgi:hypothetical protein
MSSFGANDQAQSGTTASKTAKRNFDARMD